MKLLELHRKGAKLFFDGETFHHFAEAECSYLERFCSSRNIPVVLLQGAYVNAKLIRTERCRIVEIIENAVIFETAPVKELS